MQCRHIVFICWLAATATTGVSAQLSGKGKTPARGQSVTVPFALDHNRIVIDVDLPLPDGSSQRVHGWVDSGNPDLEMSRRAAMLMGLNLNCNDKECSAAPPQEISVGGMNLSLAAAKEAKIPLEPVSAAVVMEPGMNAEINVPSVVLRNYDVLVDYPERKLAITSPGVMKFEGLSAKIQVNAQNGLIQVPSQINNKKHNLGLDVGSSFSFISSGLGDELLAASPGLPHMIGAVGAANMWGNDNEPLCKLLRLERLQYGPAFLTNVAMAEFPKARMEYFSARAGIPTVGLLGANALLNYRVGIDYAHSMAYFEVGSTFRAPDFDLIGLVLRPETDGRFTILGGADIDGHPSVPEVQSGDVLVAVDITPVRGLTMGQVWALLKGQPGQERKLTVERGGKVFTVLAKVQHFLGEDTEDNHNKSSEKH